MTLGATTAKKITLQVADVHEPLLSISRCTDMGFVCHLVQFGGYLEDTLTGEQVPLQRRHKLNVMKAWATGDPDASASSFEIPSPFVMPGRWRI